MKARYSSTRYALIAVVLGAVVGCGHFLVPGPFRPVDTADQVGPGERAQLAVQDDGTVSWSLGRLEVSARVMTDQELNRQYPTFSDDGYGPDDDLPTNVFTFGNWKDPRSGKAPSRFSVFKVSVKNYEYPKVKFDALSPFIEANNGRVYYPWGPFDFNEFFRRFPLAYNGLGYKRFRERLSMLKLALYPLNDFCFSGQEFEGYIVFDEIHDDVGEIVLNIPAVGIRYDYRDEPVETVSLAFRFSRELLEVNRRDMVAGAN